MSGQSRADCGKLKKTQKNERRQVSSTIRFLRGYEMKCPKCEREYDKDDVKIILYFDEAEIVMVCPCGEEPIIHFTKADLAEI